ALFAAVDLALFLKREGRGETTKRRLYGRGRWSVPTLIIDFDGKAYRLIGTEASVRGHERDELAAKVAKLITKQWQTEKDLLLRLDLQSKGDNYRRLGAVLNAMEGVECQGKGRRGDPRSWRRSRTPKVDSRREVSGRESSRKSRKRDERSVDGA